MNRNERKVFREFLNRHEFDAALTLDFDFAYFGSISSDSVWGTLKAWDAAVNRKLLGKNWHLAQEEHIEYFAFVEKLYSYPHLHLAVKSKGTPFAKFEWASTSAWRCLRSTDHSRRGSDVQRIASQEKWVGYITKAVTRDSWMHSSEFKRT